MKNTIIYSKNCLKNMSMIKTPRKRNFISLKYKIRRNKNFLKTKKFVVKNHLPIRVMNFGT